MKLHQIIIDRLLTQTEVTDSIGQNAEFSDAADRPAIRAGKLEEHDPYPGIVVLVPNQTVHSDLQDVVRMLTADVVVRCISHDLQEAYQLASAAAFNAQTPGERPASGLDGWRDLSKGIQSMGLRTISEEAVFAGDRSDRLLWFIDYTFSTDWLMQS